MRNNDILNMLKLDQSLIDEAIRRQIDGTCYLKNEDRDFIQELFNKTNQAIADHMALKEEFFLPRVVSNGITFNLDKNKKMTDLLGEAGFALSAERALTFKILMQTLKTELNEHEQIENQMSASKVDYEFNHVAIDSIQRRIFANVI